MKHPHLGEMLLSHVFISYQQADSDFASLLMIRLEQAGIDTWMDKQRLRAGADWSEAIDQGIRDAYALVVVMSPDAKSSEYVTYEWAHALGAGVRVIPILVRETPLHPRLARIQYLKFTDPSVRPWDALINELREESSAAPFRITRATPTYIKRAVADLDSANPDDRKGGIQCLADSEEEIAREALVHAQRHPLKDVRVRASIALAHVGDIRALEGMEEALTSTLRSGAYHSILALGTSACAFIVKGLNGSRDLSLRIILARLAREVLCSEIIPALLQALNGPPSLQAAAITSLTYLKAEGVLPSTSTLLTVSSDVDVICATINALMSFRPPDAIPQLTTFILRAIAEIESGSVQYGRAAYEAVNGIIEFADCEVIPSIVEHLHSSNATVRILIIYLIGSLKCMEYEKDLRSMVHDYAKGSTWPQGSLSPDSVTVSEVVTDALSAIHKKELNRP